jgi:hypothetical protein
MDNLEFLDGAEAPNGEAAPVVEAAVEAPAEVVTTEAEPVSEQKGPSRGPDGKFAKKEADEPIMVPLKALHETRDEVKALRAQLEAATRPPQTQQQSQVPDMFEDPEGYQSFQTQQLQTAVFNSTLNISEEMTRQQVGDDLVNEVQQWGAQAFQANPAFYQQFAQQRNPYGFLVSAYKRQQAVSQIGDDPKQIEAFLAWQQAQTAAPQPAATPQSQPQRPTGSIASAVSAGGVQHTAMGPGVAFDNVIR